MVSAEAEKLIRRCQQAVDAEKKVLVSFRIGDIWADAFTYTYNQGQKQGQPGASLKGRLLYLGWVKVDGETVYAAKPKDADRESGDQSEQQQDAQ